MDKAKKICFVIMPFGKTSEEHTESYWTDHFKEFLRPIIETNPELKAIRSKPLRGDILTEIIMYLVDAAVVIADITDYNPNVFWELGVRQSFKHGTITIAEIDTTIPFDIGSKGTLFYTPKDHIMNMQFQKDLQNAIKDCLDNPDRPDSQVLERLTGRGTLFEIFQRNETMRRIDALISQHEGNKDSLVKIIRTINKNKEGRSTRLIFSGCFLTAGVELLVTNRYIDEEDKFYDDAEYYLQLLLTMNAMVNKWFAEYEDVERWFLKQEKKFLSEFENFGKKINEIHKKVNGKV